ncbi:MAG: MAPEG family protein [Povalibacter sp.]
MTPNILTPVLTLIVWTFVIWVWMYATRLPAIRAARLNVGRIKRSDLDALPVAVKQIADNYNHLHEQPTVFYAIAFYSHLVGVADGLNVVLAWMYVTLRIVHSLVQCTSNYVPVRFLVFAAATLLLMVITARNVIALLVT